LIIFIFTVAFAASPFYTEFTGEKGYMYYRYFTYIIPLMAVVVIYAFQQTGKLRFTLSASWILICFYFSVTFMNDVTPQKDISYRAAGWVLARKYGDQPVKLKSLKAVAPEDAKQELMIGFGWGLTATLLEG
jgi:hypothetical protein